MAQSLREDRRNLKRVLKLFRAMEGQPEYGGRFRPTLARATRLVEEDLAVVEAQIKREAMKANGG